MNAVTDSYNFITIGKETIADSIDKRVNWIFFLAYLECNAAVLRITNISMVNIQVQAVEEIQKNSSWVSAYNLNLHRSSLGT